MTKYVIGPDVAIRLAHDQVAMGDEHQILAPALLRSQMLSLPCQAVHHGEMTKKDAGRRLSYVRGLRIRLLGDRVLQNVAWKVADHLGAAGLAPVQRVGGNLEEDLAGEGIVARMQRR